MIWWLAFEKTPVHFWREIWIQVVVISYYRCTYHIPSNSILPTIHPLFISKLDLFFWIFTPLNGVPIQIADMGKPFWGKPLWENLELIVICVSWIMDYTIKLRCIRDRSKTTLRKFSPILSPYPSSGQKWIFYIQSTPLSRDFPWTFCCSSHLLFLSTYIYTYSYWISTYYD